MPEGVIDVEDFVVDRSVYDVADEEKFLYRSPEGLTEELIRGISEQKGEPEWMLQKRLESYKIFLSKPMPDFGPNLDGLDLDKIYYF
ncbi:MAG: Fe-S cluster assembly protein SufB, partial [Nanoarchaeota archaeon]